MLTYGTPSWVWTDADTQNKKLFSLGGLPLCQHTGQQPKPISLLGVSSAAVLQYACFKANTFCCLRAAQWLSG